MKSYVQYPFFGLHTVAWIVFTFRCGNGTIASCGQPVTCERKLRGFAVLSAAGAVFYSQLYHELHGNKLMVSERCTGGGSKSCMLAFSEVADTSKNDDDSPAPPTHPHLTELPTMDRDNVEHLKTK
ncbi:hypothetical protein CBL_08579 [Carabus blaptoides fortunei]